MRVKWTFEKLQIEALKYKTKRDFQKYSSKAYHSAVVRDDYDQITQHMPKNICIGNKPSTYKWTPEKLQEEALKYETKRDFKLGSYSAYFIAQRRGILQEICRHMPEVSNKPWTDEELVAEALRYNRRVDFHKNSSGAFTAAWKRGRDFLDTICSHMIEYAGENHHNFKWTNEDLHIEALKYKTIAEFQKGNRSAYGLARNRNIFDEICSHMKPSRGSSLAEKELFAIIKNTYPSAKTLRDMKVRIEGKPYIHGFDIDIYIPGLNLGVEFDGTHYHSFEYMRKTKAKSKWSDDDIRNYHEIKDSWFAGKGIKILHIKEEDWKANKNFCIQECLDFLSSEQIASVA